MVDPAPPARRSIPPIRELVAVGGAFALASVVLTLPLALHPTRTLPSDLGDTLLNTWIVGWDADRLRHGLRGVWDAPIYHPYRDTLAFSENLFGLAFLVAPAYWLTGNAVLTYNIGFLFSFALAGTGMYLLLRALTASRAAAAVGGLFYAFCPYRMAQIPHVQMVATGWIPIALWGLHEYFFTRARRWLAVFAGATCFQALSNSYAAYFMAVPVVIVIGSGLIVDARRRVSRTVLELAAACALILVVLVPVGAAYYRVRSAYRLVRSPEDIAERAADLRSYLVGNNWVGIWRWLPTAVSGDPEKELFPGLVAVVLAALALSRRPSRGDFLWRWTRLYGMIALAGLVLSLGPHVRVWGTLVTRHGPYDWLLRTMPGMDGMRVPARFAIIFFLGLSAMAGFGAAVVLARLRPRLQRIVLVAVLAAVAAEGWSVPLPVQRYSGGGRAEDRAVAEALRDAPPGAVLHLPINTNNFQELNYQYATLVHLHPLVNGFSGYNTPLQEFLRVARSPLYDYERFPAAVGMLRALGVRHVVVHPGDYSVTQLADGELTNTLRGFRTSGQTVAETRRLGVSIFELLPWRDTPGGNDPVLLVRSDEIDVSVSEADDRRPFLIDGNLDSRWIGGHEGSSWIAARFRRPYDIARVDVQLARRSLEDYPRELQIEGVDAHGQSHALYRATAYPELIAGLIRDPAYPTLSISLPRNEIVSLLIRETAIDPGQWWSVHELRFWRRP